MGPEDRQFPDFYVSQFGRLRRLGFLLTGDWAQAEDLAQEALVRVYWRWSLVRRQAHPEAYARKVLVNRHRSLLRRLRLEARHAQQTRVEAPGPGRRDDLLAVQAAIGRLPARQRAVLVLRYHEDLTEREVARLPGRRACPRRPGCSPTRRWWSAAAARATTPGRSAPARAPGRTTGSSGPARTASSGTAGRTSGRRGPSSRPACSARRPRSGRQRRWSRGTGRRRWPGWWSSWRDGRPWRSPVFRHRRFPFTFWVLAPIPPDARALAFTSFDAGGRQLARTIDFAGWPDGCRR